MNHFPSIKLALEYVDAHLDEDIRLEALAARFHFSPYYFHRIFSAIVGKPLAAYIRDRRLLFACLRLAGGKQSVLEIALDCGYQSAASFARAFKKAFGLTAQEYRRQGLAPAMMTAEETIQKFTNRLRGGIDVNPSIIKRGMLLIAGFSGDSHQTYEVWTTFEKLQKKMPLSNTITPAIKCRKRLYGGKKLEHFAFCVVNAA